jgi:hypothetical protein
LGEFLPNFDLEIMSKLAQSFYSWKEKNCICQKKWFFFVETKLNSNEYIEWQMSYATWIKSISIDSNS